LQPVLNDHVSSESVLKVTSWIHIIINDLVDP